VNQQVAPTGELADGWTWQLVGSYWIGSGQMTVTLSDDANGAVAADAIRIVDPPTTLYWDPDGNPTGNNITTGAGLGGDGNWTTGTGTYWYNPSSGTDIPWADGDIAVFMGRPRTVSILTTVQAASVQFASSGYTIAGGTLTLTTSDTHTIQVNSGTATISSVIGGSNGMTKTGAGALVLGAASGYTGNTAIQNGTLQLNVPNALPIGATLTFGTASTNGILELNGQSQQVDSLWVVALSESFNV
jgi:autotransporter-associated beta strand protein